MTPALEAISYLLRRAYEIETGLRGRVGRAAVASHGRPTSRAFSRQLCIAPVRSATSRPGACGSVAIFAQQLPDIEREIIEQKQVDLDRKRAAAMIF